MKTLRRQFPSLLCVMVACAMLFSGTALSAQDWAKSRLEQSPRHREYAKVTYDGRTVNTYIAYPEVKNKATVVILIHEIFGLSDWMKLQADELAAKGYIVLAPDLLSAQGGTDQVAAAGGQDAVIKAVIGLDKAQVNADLDAVADYGRKLASANGKLAVGGFCWGGGTTFAYATHRPDLSAAFVFYGPPPPAGDMAKIKVPVYGFYAGNDARISATIPQATEDMKAAGKIYQPVVYDGAGHGFMRAGQAPDANEANKKAFDEGFARMVKTLQEIR
jgi:carboxymethylenebutenolidase